MVVRPTSGSLWSSIRRFTCSFQYLSRTINTFSGKQKALYVFPCTFQRATPCLSCGNVAKELGHNSSVREPVGLLPTTSTIKRMFPPKKSLTKLSPKVSGVQSETRSGPNFAKTRRKTRDDAQMTSPRQRRPISDYDDKCVFQ